MASQWIFLERTVSAPELHSTSLDKPFGPGQSITFVSTSYDPGADRTVGRDSAGFYFTKGNDVLLNIAIRRGQNRIVFNTRQGGIWGNEQSVALQGVFTGPRAFVHVTANAYTYTISFNNDCSHAYTFTKIIQEDPTGVLYFESNFRRVFSNPVITAVFDSVQCAIFVELLVARGTVEGMGNHFHMNCCFYMLTGRYYGANMIENGDEDEEEEDGDDNDYDDD